MNSDKMLSDDQQVKEALATVGVHVNGVYDLLNRSKPYPAAIPVLLHQLRIVQSARIKEGIVRALSVKEAKGTAAPTLISEFNQAGDPLLKWAIGNALSVVADDAVFTQLVDLVTDKNHGKAREMLVLALACVDNPSAIDILIDLLNDEQTAGHAVIALGKLKAGRARDKIASFLVHPKAWIRKEAAKALRRISN